MAENPNDPGLPVPLSNGDGQPPPKPATAGNGSVAAAFSLGWHMAEIRYLVEDPATRPDPKYLLPVVRELEPLPRSELVTRQIESDLAGLGYPPPPQAGDLTTENVRLALELPWPPASRPLAQVEADPTQPGTSGSLPQDPGQLPQADAVSSLHREVLLTLTARDFRLGKAYAVGVELSETVLVSYKLCTGRLKPATTLGKDMEALFAAPRVNRIARRIRDLKGYFSPYASDAVSATLIDWGRWVRAAQSQPNVDWQDVGRRYLYPQGQDWRALLSGEKKPTDELQVPDYINGLRHLLGRYWELFRGFAGRWTALVPIAALLVLAAATVALWNRQQLPAAWAAAVSFLGLFGLSGATIAAAIKNALNQAEQHLWQAELAAAVAAAIDKVPTPVDESAVGSLAGNPKYRKRIGVRQRFRATGLTRWQGSGAL